MTVKDLLLYAIKNGSSDLHLVAGVPPIVRTDGKLSYIEKTRELSSKDIETIAFSIISEAQKERFQSTKDLDFGSFTIIAQAILELFIEDGLLTGENKLL